jgi:glycosyltransferase involved in cell wall biosynthesis
MTMTISVVLATFNEEKNLPKTLDAIKDFADEIIVVDGTSNDKTVEIAKNYGARVLVRENPKIFHINKQIAIDMAKEDWILQLDADEIADEDLKNEIKEKIKDNKFNGYWMPRKNYFLGRFLMKGGQYPDYTLRLYRTGKGKLPQKDVHEQAVVDGEVGYLNSALLHYPYENFSAYYSKWKRYNDIFADQIRSERKNKTFLQKLKLSVKYLCMGPYWFLLTYLRHKGFMDLWPGFVFSFFSALRFPASYVKSFNG